MSAVHLALGLSILALMLSTLTFGAVMAWFFATRRSEYVMQHAQQAQEAKPPPVLTIDPAGRAQLTPEQIAHLQRGHSVKDPRDNSDWDALS